MSLGQRGGIVGKRVPQVAAAAGPEVHWLPAVPKAAADVPIARLALVAMPAAAAAADHPGNPVPRFPSHLLPAAENQGFVTVMLQRWHKPTSHQRQRASRNRASAAAALTV